MAEREIETFPAYTVGDLRSVLDGLPEDTPVRMRVEGTVGDVSDVFGGAMSRVKIIIQPGDPKTMKPVSFSVTLTDGCT